MRWLPLQSDYLTIACVQCIPVYRYTRSLYESYYILGFIASSIYIFHLLWPSDCIVFVDVLVCVY